MRKSLRLRIGVVGLLIVPFASPPPLAVPWPSDWIRRQIIGRIEGAFGGELSIASADLHYFPPGMTLVGMRFHRLGPDGDEVRASCRRAELSFPYRAYLGRFDRIDSLTLESPGIDWRRTASSGRPGAPSSASSPAGGSLTLGRLEVKEGSLRLRSPTGDWEATLSHVGLRGAESGEKGRIEGRLERGRVSVRNGENRFDGSLVGKVGLERSRISVSSFALNQTADPIHAAGSLELDLAGAIPRLHLELDAALAKPRAPRPVVGDLFGGLRLDASGSSGPEGLRMEGTVRARQLSYHGVEARGLAASVAYRDGSLEVSRVEAALLGGRLKGDATLRWSQAAASASLLEARISLGGGSAADVLRFLAVPDLPLSGRLDHEGEYRIRSFDPASVEGRGSLKFSGVATFGGKRAATGTARFTLRDSSLAIEEARLQLPSGSVRFQGDVPLAAPAEARGNVEASTTHLEDLSPLVSKLPESLRRPFSELMADSTGGDLKLMGRLTGGAAGPSLEGRASGHRLALRGRSLGDLEVDFRLTPHRVDLKRVTLAGGETLLDATGWFERDASPPQVASLALQGNVTRLDAKWVKEWALLDWPVGGDLTARFDLEGSAEKLQGRVDWSLERPVLASIPMDAASGRFSLSPGKLVVDAVSLTRGSGAITASGTVGFSGGPIQAHLEAHEVELDWFRETGWLPLEARGKVSFRAEVTGTLDEPALGVDLETPGSSLKGVDVGAVSARVDADRRGATVRIVPALKGLALSGQVRWDDGLPFEAELNLDHFEAAAASLGVAFTGIDSRVILSGNLQASGMLRDPSRLDVSGNLVNVSLTLGSEELVSQAPAYVRWRPPRLEVTPLHLAGRDSDVTLSGQVEPASGAYRFGAEGKLSLRVLTPLWPDITAAGTGAFSVSLIGSTDATRVEGWASVLDARLQGGGLPFPVTSLEGRLVLDPPDRFHLEGVHLVAGGGAMSLEGGGTVRGMRPAHLDLSLKGSDVQVLYPEGFRGRYDMALQLVRGDAGGRIAGTVNLVRGVYSKDFKIESRLLSLGAEGGSAVAELEGTDSGVTGLLGPIELDLKLTADDELWILNDFATLEGRAALRVGGTLGEPQVTGRITAFEGGTINFRKVPYRILRGNIDLIDLGRLDPYFDLLAETRVADYQIILKIDGTLERFEYELSSTPPLPQPDIIALLVSGRTLDTLISPLGGGRYAGELAAGYLAGSLTQGIGGSLQNVTGLDQFSIDPVILTRQGDPASRVTVGKQISENLFATSSVVLGTTSEESYQLEYRLSRDFRLTSSREADGSVGGDLRYLWRRSTGPGEIPAAPRAVRKKIGEVKLEGSPGIGRWRLLRLLRLRPGDEIDRVRSASGVERILDRYHRRGYLQARVETREEPVEGRADRANLVLRVDPGPKVEIRVSGTGADRKHAKELRALWLNSIFPEETPQEAREKLEKILREKGYLQAAVAVTMPVDTPDRRQVVLSARTGARARVEKVEIEGNANVETSELERVIQTKPGPHAIFHPGVADSDAGRIRGHYLSLGYAEAKIPPPRVDLSEDGTRATVRFQVEEGEPVKIGAVRVEGNASIPSRTLLEGFPIQEGGPFIRAKARAGAESIRRQYDRAGFPDAKVSFELRPTTPPELVCLVEEGTRRTVGRIEIEGIRMTRREVVERELTFREGSPLSREEILKSQRALYRLGIFRSVEIQEAEGSDPQRPTLRIQVAESPNLTQSVGIGYGSDEGVRGLYEATDANFFGRARTVGLQLRGSGIDSRVVGLLKDPYLFNRRLDSLLTAYWERQERESFTLRTRGSSLQVSNKHGEHDRTVYRYTLKDVSLSDLRITEEEAGFQSLRLSGLAAAFIHDSRDDFFNPRKGSFASFDLEAFGRAIGSEAQFLKFVATGSHFTKLPGDSVWAQSVRLGLADPFGASDSLPLSERFFAGGDTSVRGFRRDGVGPKDPLTGKPTGGETLFIINEEFRYPIWRMLRGVVFFDAGNVTSRFSEFDPTDLRTVLGLGFRIDTPIGPFRVEYGWKLDREDEESPGELHISIGQAF